MEILFTLGVFFQIFQSNVIMFKYVVTWVRKIGFDVISGKQGPTP